VEEAHVRKLMSLFERALEVPDEKRRRFLDELTGSDVKFRTEVESLLDAHGTSAGFFEDLSDKIVSPVFAPVLRAAHRARESALLPRVQQALGARYDIIEGLGGGMSRVFLGVEKATGRKVVIKVLPPELALTAFAERFRREIRMVARLEHPRIAPILESDSAGKLLYYSMPYIPGESLRDRLSREEPLTVADTTRIWHDILEALAHAHERGVIHRDIKPANILLSGSHAVVCDFGIAQAIEASSADSFETPAGMTVGTPAYMAPEQVKGDPKADHRMDIYAAALVMYEMLEGRMPFSGRTNLELGGVRLKLDPPPIGRNDCPASLSRLVMHCLAREPSRRPSSAPEVIRALDAAVPS
jgi:serine/threonine protein kinase